MAMKVRTLGALVVCGAVALGGGWYFGLRTTPSEQNSVETGKLMFPDLAPRLQQAMKIEVVHQGKPMVIDKSQIGTQVRWGLADRGEYPVQETKLRSMLTALTELRLVEQRTSEPDQYAQLGVEDPNAKDSTSNLVRVLDASGKPIVALIVGHRRVRTGGNAPEEVYVRSPDGKTSWLAQGSLDIDSDPQVWLDRDVMNIDHSRIAEVDVKRGEETLDFARINDKFALTSPADQPKLDDYKLEDVSRALELLTFDDVQPAGAKLGDEVGRSVFTTSDGLRVTVTVYHSAESTDARPRASRDVLARFAIAGSNKAKAEADRLQARVSGWTYRIGAWKEKSLVPALNDLQPPEPEKPSGSATATTPQATKP